MHDHKWPRSYTRALREQRPGPEMGMDRVLCSRIDYNIVDLDDRTYEQLSSKTVLFFFFFMSSSILFLTSSSFSFVYSSTWCVWFYLRRPFFFYFLNLNFFIFSPLSVRVTSLRNTIK